MRSVPGALTMLACIVVAAPPARAYFERVDTSSRALAFGDAYVALSTDVAATTWNPAGLALVRQKELQASVSRPYFVPDLLSNSIVLGGSFDAGGWGLAWHRLGNEFIAENLWFASYGRWLYRDDFATLHAGGALKIAHVSVDAAPDQPDYGSITRLTGDIGILAQTRTGWNLGAVLRNLGEPEIEFVDGGGGTVLDADLDLGVAYGWRPESTVSAGWTSSGRTRDAFRVGGEIWFYDVFAVRAGILGTEFSGGFGLDTGRWQLDSSFVTHQQLGLSGQMTLSVPFGTPRPEQP